MAKYSRVGIYNRVATIVQTAHSSVTISGTYLPVVKSFPYVYLHEIDHVQTTSGLDLECKDNQWESTFEVQVFTTGDNKIANAHTILDTIKGAFRTMYFRQSYEGEIENTDITVYRLVARFNRTIGGGEDMPTQNT